MLIQKHCHGGLKAKASFFGLEPLDMLLLFPAMFICVVVARQPMFGVIITFALAGVIRILKWGRLPGYTLDLVAYAIFWRHMAVLGRDRMPPYPFSGSPSPIPSPPPSSTSSHNTGESP